MDHGDEFGRRRWSARGDRVLSLQRPLQKFIDNQPGAIYTKGVTAAIIAVRKEATSMASPPDNPGPFGP